MTKEKLQAILDTMPASTLIYVRAGDNAWPARPRRFEYQGKPQNVLYLDHVGSDEDGDHLNYPEGYSGAKEIPVKGMTNARTRSTGTR